jgi:hypothetical protein
MKQYPPIKRYESNLDIPVLENEECWAIRVIDESQKASNLKLVNKSTSSETSALSNCSNSLE